jgi:tryptophan-rich sensory protein
LVALEGDMDASELPIGFLSFLAVAIAVAAYRLWRIYQNHSHLSAPFLFALMAVLNVRFGVTESGLLENTARFLITLIILGAALFVILSQAIGDSSEKLAFAVVGTVLGFWLPARS